MRSRYGLAIFWLWLWLATAPSGGLVSPIFGGAGPRISIPIVCDDSGVSVSLVRPVLALAAVSVSAAMLFRTSASQYVSATGGPRQGWERDETIPRAFCALAAKDTSKAAKSTSEERA